MKKITLLGAGLIGNTIAKDLAKLHQVKVVDINAANLEALANIPNITTELSDVTDPLKLRKSIEDADLVVGAVPGFMGFNMVKNVLKAKKNIVDISFFPEDPFALNALAKENGVSAIVDCGVAPGLDNIICGYYHEMYEVESFACYVGGLPKIRQFPFAYKAPFSPIDVIEEYIRPARLVENGQIVTKPALSESELLEFKEVGTLQAFNTDGLRTLLKLPIPHMKEKTLRYPGHITYIKALKSIGFFNEEEIEVNGQMIRPIDMTSKILLPQWKLNHDDEEFTVMDVIVKYKDNGVMKEDTYHLYDAYDPATKTHSMSRTTGFTCTAICKCILHEEFTEKGVFAGEHIGMNKERFDSVINHLAERNVHLQVTKKTLDA